MSGLLCPKCGGSFRAGFTRCGSCNVDLVDKATYEGLQAAKGSSKQALAGKKTVAIVHAGLQACREIERALRDSGIHCYVEAAEDEGEPLARGALKVGLFVAEEDLQRAGNVLKQRFESMLKAEGVGSFNTEAIDLTADEIQCPACGTKAPLKNGECSDCGLFLGAPE